MLVVGGLIVGNPDDTRESIAANLTFAREHVDWPYIQHPTPYPGTPMTREFRERGLIVNRRVDEYDGTTAVTRSAHLDAGEIEFMRWRAERWMKVRHMATAFRHDPAFVLRNGRRMFAHTFRGSTLALGGRPRKRARRVFALSRDPPARTELHGLARSASAGVGPRYAGRADTTARPDCPQGRLTLIGRSYANTMLNSETSRARPGCRRDP